MPARPARPSTADRPSGRVVPAPPPALALDFANTLYWRGMPAPTETLTGVDALIGWLESVHLIDAAAAVRLRTMAGAEPAAAARLFEHCIDLRERIYRMVGHEGQATSDDVDRLNAMLAAAPKRDMLLPGGPGHGGWQLPPLKAESTAAELLAPVIWSAADLLLADKPERIKRCANQQCRWLFLDDSKAATRRWCFMSSCGNRAKAHRHYARKTGRVETAG